MLGSTRGHFISIDVSFVLCFHKAYVICVQEPPGSVVGYDQSGTGGGGPCGGRATLSHNKRVTA